MNLVDTTITRTMLHTQVSSSAEEERSEIQHRNTHASIKIVLNSSLSSTMLIMILDSFRQKYIILKKHLLIAEAFNFIYCTFHTILFLIFQPLLAIEDL